MSKVSQNNNENKSPTLYSYYGKQYDFNDLRRDSDLGFRDYIGNLRRGDKDFEEFMNAYSNIMNGIEDGSITFEDGRFNDSLGRYSNGTYYDSEGNKQTSKKKSRDYYGLVANYIASKLGKSDEYQAPEDKSKITWQGGNSLGLAFNRRMFNSDTPNIQDFIDLDPYQEDTKSRSTTNRASQSSKAIDYLYNNFDRLFSGYSDIDYNQSRENLENAQKALSNGLNPEDYLLLSRAIPGVDWREMFSDNYTTQQQIPTTGTDYTPSSSTEQGRGSQQNPELTDQFTAWLNQNYPKYQEALKTKSLASNITYSNDEISKLNAELNSLSDSELTDRIKKLITPQDSNYVFYDDPIITKLFSQGSRPVFTNQYGMYSILNVLKNKGKLHAFESNPNLYYIPNSATKDNVGWVWDSANNTIQQMHLVDIPYWQKKLFNDFKKAAVDATGNSYYDTDLSWISSFLQKGGVLKAQTGIKLNDNANWSSGVFYPQLDYITEKLKSEPEYYKWLNSMQGKHAQLYNAAGPNFYDTAYSSDDVGVYQDLYKSGYNNEWKDNPIGYNSLGITNAYNQNMFDVFGNNTRVSGDWGDKSWKTDKLYSAVTDYRRLLGREGDFTDEQLNKLVDQFKQIGYNFYLDDNDKYYKLSVIQSDPGKVEKQGNQDNSSSDSEGVQGNSSHIIPLGEKEKKNREGFTNFLLRTSPDLIGAGRLFASLNTNNRVANTIRESLRPMLRDTYERYSPVTGAFGEMQFRNQQGDDLRRQAALPFTSDASLQLARQLDADRQAQELEYKGFLANNQEIRRTQAEALNRAEDNMARRSQVANLNREEMHKVDREKAELEAARLRRNWQSVDNFLQGVEGRYRNRLEDNFERRNNFRLQTTIADVDNRYYDAIQSAQESVREWQTANPGKSLSSMPNYDNYVNFMREMQQWRQAQQFGAHANIYGYTFDNDMLNKDPQTIKDKYHYRRNGGTLRPSTMYLINKVLRNENNT